MRYRILPYRQGSASAKALATALGGKVLRLQGSTYVARSDDMVINWGFTGFHPCQGGPAGRWMNSSGYVRNASNKLNFFNLMKEENSDIIPEFWTDAEEIPDDAFPIVCRTVLAGHSGDGIVMASNRDGLVPASLYVRYVKKAEEYRVHVGMDYASYPESEERSPQIIAVQRKARRHDTPDEEVNWQVRNHSNGFVFTRNGFTAPDAVLDAARRALEATGLDFGGVDIVWNAQQQRAYAIEVNTACGLEGQTIEDYANFFRVV